MRINYLLLFTILILSCQKEMSEERDYPTIPPVIIDSIKPPIVADSLITTPNTSKLKSIIERWENNRIYKTTLEYDALNRVHKFNEWMEDLSVSPATILRARYCTFSYNGNDVYPFKNTFTDENGIEEYMLYTYDNNNRIIVEDYYRENKNVVRFAYEYISATLMKTKLFETMGGNNFIGISIDSCIFDNQGKIIEKYMYQENVLKATTIYNYDNKLNPFSEINVFKYIYCIHGDRQRIPLRAKNNLKKTLLNYYFSNVEEQSWLYNYTYNNNGSPKDGSVSYVSTNPNESGSITLTYEYY